MVYFIYAAQWLDSTERRSNTDNGLEKVLFNVQCRRGSLYRSHTTASHLPDRRELLTASWVG